MHEIGNAALVGREDLLQRLRFCDGGAVLVGPSGVGKTRAGRAAAAAAGSGSGQRFKSVRGTRSTAGLPLAAVAGLLPETAECDSGVRVVELFQAAGRRLRENAAGHRPVLLVDDADLLDAESAALVHYLATAGRVHVLVTAADLGQAPDAIRALGEVAGFDVFEVMPLQWRDTAALVEGLLEGPAESLLLSRVFELSGGKPLWIRELLRAGLDGGGITYVYQRWRWRFLCGETAHGLRQRVERRLRSASATAGDAAVLVALAERVPAGLVAEVVGASAVDEAERTGLIHGQRCGRRHLLTVSHPVYGAILRTQLTEFTRTRLLGQLAGRLRATGMRRDGDLVQVADWSLQVGRVETEVLMQGAEQARRRRAWPLAATLADAAAAYGAGPAATHLGALAALHQHQWGPADGVTRAASQPLSADEPAADTVARAEGLLFGQARPDAAATVLDQLPKTDTALGQQATALRAAVALNRGDVSAALCAVPPCRSAGTNGAPMALITVACSALTWCGRPGEARELAAATPVAASDSPPSDMPAMLAATRCVADGLSGDLTAARTRVSDQLGCLPTDEALIWTYTGGQLALYAGDAAAAVDLLGSAALPGDGAPTHLGPSGHANALGGLAEANALLGHASQAEEAYRQARAALLAGCFSADVEIAGIALHLCRGENSAACRAAEATCEFARECDAHLNAGRAAYTLVRAGQPARACEALQQLASHTGTPLVRAWLAHAQAARDGDPADLSHASDTLAHFGLFLAAAEAAASAARITARRGAQATSCALRERALAHTRACPGVTTPALAALSLPAVLTPREDEIAQLAAYAIPSPAIATRLGISTRTVDNHLQRIYRKLGVRGRPSLAALFGQQHDHQIE